MKQRETLKLIIRNDLSNITHKLYAKDIISEETYYRALNELCTTNIRTMEVLNALESKMRVESSIFTEFVNILESDPYTSSLADELIQSYSEFLRIS